MFGSAGFGVSLRTIADTADVSAGLIVHHFGSKERLRQAVDQADPYGPENTRRRTEANLDFIARGLFTQPA